MHELSIAAGIVSCVLAEAEQRGFGRINAIHLRLGPLAGIDREALLFSYEVASADTALSATRLVIEPVEVVLRCSTCGEGRRPRRYPQMLCPDCGLPAEVTSGGELELSALEVES